MTQRSIFISHSQRDADVAKRVGKALMHFGLAPFDPRQELEPGEDFRKAIQLAIKRSDAVIMLAVTPHHLSSSWMSYEAGVAEALGKRVMLLLPNKYPMTELPADFASAQIVDFDPQAPERAAHDIAARLAAV
jgi:nucleoside 2-deoxyribosyltransferase